MTTPPTIDDFDSRGLPPFTRGRSLTRAPSRPYLRRLRTTACDGRLYLDALFNGPCLITEAHDYIEYMIEDTTHTKSPCWAPRLPHERRVHEPHRPLQDVHLQMGDCVRLSFDRHAKQKRLRRE